ncbi:hypothetical protein [Halalkalibacter lacteus]|uniref:hypothetical protein n=1 Tax=Halalkalibacter lacteus TaxID=3090663 RepID=UPI002FC84BAB
MFEQIITELESRLKRKLTSKEYIIMHTNFIESSKERKSIKPSEHFLNNQNLHTQYHH